MTSEADSKSGPCDKPTRPDRLRLFPIGGLVMFPSLMQGLHVFEPRYRALVRDTLADQGLFALPVPLATPPGCCKPPLARIACAVRIVRHERFADGRYDLSVAGLQRVELIEELEEIDGYRSARVRWLDEAEAVDPVDAAWVRSELLQMFHRLLAQTAPQADQIAKQLQQAVTLSMLADLVAYVVPFPLMWKLELLHELAPTRRARRILAYHASLVNASGQPFDSSDRPTAGGTLPKFSLN